MKRGNFGFTLVDILLAMIIGVFLVILLAVFTINIGKMQKTTSIQKNLQMTGEYILNDIAKEVSDASNTTPLFTPDRLVLEYIPPVTTPPTSNGSIAYERVEYPELGVYHVRKKKAAGFDTTGTEKNLGDPQQIVNIENIKFSYHDINGKVTNVAADVNIVKTTISLTSRFPDKTNQRIRLSGVAVLNQTKYGATHGNADVGHPGPGIQAKTVITVKRRWDLFASVTREKGGTDSFAFKLPVSTNELDTYSIVALPQITDPLDPKDYIYKALPLIPPPNDYGRFLSEVSTDVERSFRLELDQTKFIVSGEIKISDDTFFEAYTGIPVIDPVYQGPTIDFTVTADNVNNYPNKDFHPCGRLKDVNLTGGPVSSSLTMCIRKKSDSTVLYSKTVSTLPDGTATFTFDQRLPSYANPVASFAKIAAFRDITGGGVWEYQGFVSSREEVSGSGKFQYSFPASAGGVGLSKNDLVLNLTPYRLMLVRENTSNPGVITAAPETLYYIQVEEGHSNPVNMIDFEPGKEKSYDFIYAP